MRIALYQPEIPQNAGSIMRLAACLAVTVDIIAPCGFLLDDRRLRRAALDYADPGAVVRHDSWAAFLQDRRREGNGGRLVLLTATAAIPHVAFAFRPDDILLLGRESDGVPDHVRDAADSRVKVPIRRGLRSLNVATAAALVLGEVLRQLDLFPGDSDAPA